MKDTPMWALVTTMVLFLAIIVAGFLLYRSSQNSQKAGRDCADQLIANAGNPSYTTTPDCRP